MRRAPNPQLDFIDTSILERLLPTDHELQRIKATVDWGYVDAETADLYSPGVGRPAYPAPVLFRMLFLEHYATLSDVEVADQCRYNLLYRAFVGLPLSGPTPDDTTLVVFRRRLGVGRFGGLFDGLVAQCQAAGLLEQRLKIVDATHVVANVAIPNSVNLLREARRKVVGAVETDTGTARPDLRERFQTDAFIRGVPTAAMLTESVALSDALLQEIAPVEGVQTAAARALLEQVLRPTDDTVASVVDPEARLGYKTPKKPFVGYKLHVARGAGGHQRARHHGAGACRQPARGQPAP